MKSVKQNFKFQETTFKFLAILLLCGLGFGFWNLPLAGAAAGITRTINFQGKIVNKTGGTNVTDGTYTFTFKIFDASTLGNQLWGGAGGESQSLTVTNGIFQAALGSVRSFATDNLDFNQDNLWLEISFNGETFGSRIRLAAVPYAFTAEKVSGLTVTNNGGNTLTIAANKTFTVNNSIAFSGTDATTMTLPSTSTTLAGLSIANAFTNSQTITVSTATGNGLTINTTGITTGASFKITGGTAVTTGGDMDINGAVYIHTAAETGNLAKFTFTDNSTNTAGASITNGLDIESAFTTTGAGTKTITGLNISAPTTASCTTGACTWNGLKVNIPAAANTTANGILLTSNANVPGTDMMTIDNTGSTGVATAGVSGLQINYKGGTGAIESSAERIDFNPGGSSGATWNGLRLVSNATGPATGVTESGIKIESPTTGGAGTFNGVNILNLLPATNGTVNGLQFATSAITQSAANTASLRGLFLTSPGALNTNTAAGTINWDGVNLTTPGITSGFAGSTINANALKLTLGATTQTAGTAINTGINIIGASSNGSGTQNAIKINNITPGNGTDDGLVIGAGWDNGLLVQSTAAFTQTTGQTGVTVDYGTNFTAASAQNITGASFTLPTLTSSGTQTYTGLLVTPNAITTNTGSNFTYNGLNITTPNITLTAGLATANGAKITIGTTGVGGAQNGLLITPAATTNAGSVTDAINIGNVTTSSGTDTAIAIGTGWDNSILGAGALSINTNAGNISFQPAGTSTTANVQIGAGGAGSTTPDILVTDAKSTSGDPTAVNGGSYYNVSTNEMKCGEGSAWTHCTGWQFLGRATWSSGNTVGPIVLTTTRKHLMIRGQIVYGASGIARLRFGNAAIDTGTTYNAKISESLAAATTWTITNVTSNNGVPVANTAINTQRSFVAEVEPNAANVVKRVYIRTDSNTTSAATVPDAQEVWGLWVPATASDVINRVDLLSCTAASGGCSAANLAAGTEIEVWGRDDD